jgi:hypothetical protein
MPTSPRVHASVAFLRGSEVCIWRAFVEYGSDPGSYARIASAGLGQQVNSNQLALPPVRLTGLSLGTTYHYRIVFDQGFCAAKEPTLYRSYSSPSNSFTTAVSPQAGGAYGIAIAADETKFIDVPGSSTSVGQNLWLYQGNGTPAQQWRLVDSRARDGYFKIVSNLEAAATGDPGLCLEIRGGSIAGAPIDQYTCDVNAPDQPNQLWQPVRQADGTYLLKSKGGLLLSSAGGTASATGLIAASATSAPDLAQKWSFIPLRAALTCSGEQATVVAGRGSRRLITPGPDVILGSPTADVIDGGGGDDLICGGGGDDRLLGGWGDDHMSGARGNDRLSGGVGSDRLSGGTGNDRLSDRLGSDPLEKGLGGNHVSGGPGNDRITSTGGWPDLIECKPGHDRATADLLDRLLRCERALRVGRKPRR